MRAGEEGLLHPPSPAEPVRCSRILIEKTPEADHFIPQSFHFIGEQTKAQETEKIQQSHTAN